MCTIPSTAPETRSLIPENAAITCPKSVMSTRLKLTSPGLGGLLSPAGRAMSIETTWSPRSIRCLTAARPTLPLPPVTMIVPI
jgi:hypothetical protein